MWFTLAVEQDSPLGLQGTLDVLQELTDAESIRQLPTLKLFKIRMDLEMAGDTEALSVGGRRRGGRSSSRSSTTTSSTVAVIRATQGDLPVVPEPWARPPSSWASASGRAARRTLRG